MEFLPWCLRRIIGVCLPLVAALLSGCTLLPTKDALVDPDSDGSPYGEDCNDGDAASRPGASEIWYDGIDNDCDPTTTDNDADGDGYAAAVMGGADCDDTNADVGPEAIELCDGADNDCDGVIDEDDAADTSVWYIDQDGDRYGDSTTTTTACARPEGYQDVAGDCNDRDDTTYPGAAEVCDDGIVNDCDGNIASAMESCGLGGTRSLSGADIKLTGEAEDDYAGHSVSSAGDVDGDGLNDLLVGAYGEDSGGTDAGAVYLLLGGGALDEDSSALSLSVADLKLTGEAGGHYAGISVSSAGDLDGDGLDDLLIGAYGEDSDGSPAGAAYVLFGGDSLYGASAVGSHTLSLSEADLKLTGEAAYDLAGYCVSSAGDVDGDGLDDVLVGAYGADTVGSAAGAAYLLLGGGSLYEASGANGLSEADLILTGEAEDDRASWSVSDAGDVDSDGLDDLIVGAPGNDRGGSTSGAAYLLLGGGTIDPGSETLSLSDADIKLTGVAAYDTAGISVSGDGDVDGDGVADVIVGAYAEDSVATDAGAAYLLLGGGALDTASEIITLSNADLRLTGEAEYDYAGGSVSVTGDFDGDGLNDLLIGAHAEDAGGAVAGAAYLVFSPATGTLALSDAFSKLTGEAEGTYAGVSVSIVGDVNGDSLDDLLVGAYGENTGGIGAGAAYLVFGRGY